MTSKLVRIGGYEVWAMYDQKTEIVELPTGKNVRLDYVKNVELDPNSLLELGVRKAFDLENRFYSDKYLRDKVINDIELGLN